MVVIILENAPPSLRGELSRWMIEPKAGVYIGHLSAMVRDLLWAKCCDKVREGGVIQAWSTNNEQRYKIRMFGDTTRSLASFDGLYLVRTKPAQRRDK